MAKLKSGRHKSALKELRKSRKRKEQNKLMKDKIKTLVRKFKKAINKKEKEKVQDLLKELYSLIDKTAKKNIIHKNKAARKKSQLTKLANTILAQK